MASLHNALYATCKWFYQLQQPHIFSAKPWIFQTEFFSDIVAFRTQFFKEVKLL